MDHEEISAFITKMTAFCTLIIITCVLLSQLDVENVFLNGVLQEEVYMVLPLGVSHNLREVCKLKKVLYSLKQTPCAWFANFFDVLIFLGFHLVIMILHSL